MTPRFGATPTPDGVSFALWAPAAKRVDVLLQTPHAMRPQSDGWFTLDVSGLKAGAHYRFRIDDNLEVPDPASAFQPHDIAGPSEVIDHAAYAWQATDWRGRPWHDTVLLEAHVGSFSAEGSYDAMIARLDSLVATGFTALELMPLADFPGSRNWGYDGVLWFAPDSIYGRPEDLKRLIDQAHLRGLMVFLDVVYNHFGPDGNYLGSYAPQFFGDEETPWGKAIDYSVPQVRGFAIENALHWLRDYRFDGLRLDAVHAIPQRGEISMLHELSRAVGELAASSDRHIHLVLENDDNRATLLDPLQDPPRGQYRSQWNDDYHHAWHVLLTGESRGYYSDYAPDPLQHLMQALRSGFAYQGEASPHRAGQLRGEPSGGLAPAAFVNFLQNHDQIGNRPFGDRLDVLAPAPAVEAALAITLLSPMIPMLFMGEQWGSTTPFPFFCDFQGELADAVRNGRRREFADAYATHGDEVPDPLELRTFQSAVLDWSESHSAAGRQRLDLVQRLLAVRRDAIMPLLQDCRFGDAVVDQHGLLSAHWQFGTGGTLRLVANLSDQPVPHNLTVEGTILWGGDLQNAVPPWAVYCRIEES